MISFDRFPNGKRKALTMSYDDGKIYDRRLVEIFNKYGIRGTFHINGGYLDNDELFRISSDEVKTLYAGHEVSAHGYTHKTLTMTPKENIIFEIVEDRKTLENLVGYPVRGCSYANGLYNNDIVKALDACGIEYCRTIDSTGKFTLPENFLLWHPTCHHRNNSLELGKKFLELDHKSRLHLMYVWGHAIDLENENQWELMEEFCKMMSGSEEIWYATNIEIVDYMNALKQLRFSADLSYVYNPTALKLWFSCNGHEVIIAPGETLCFK